MQNVAQNQPIALIPEAIEAIRTRTGQKWQKCQRKAYQVYAIQMPAGLIFANKLEQPESFAAIWQATHKRIVEKNKISTELASFLNQHGYYETDGNRITLCGTQGELWTVKPEKFAQSYTTVNKTPFNAPPLEWTVALRAQETKPSAVAIQVPSRTVGIYQTSWGDMLTVNHPAIKHGKGDFLVAPFLPNGQIDYANISPMNHFVFINTMNLNVGGWANSNRISFSGSYNYFTLSECVSTYQIPSRISMFIVAARQSYSSRVLSYDKTFKDIGQLNFYVHELKSFLPTEENIAKLCSIVNTQNFTQQLSTTFPLARLINSNVSTIKSDSIVIFSRDNTPAVCISGKAFTCCPVVAQFFEPIRGKQARIRKFDIQTDTRMGIMEWKDGIRGLCSYGRSTYADMHTAKIEADKDDYANTVPRRNYKGEYEVFKWYPCFVFPKGQTRGSVNNKTAAGTPVTKGSASVNKDSITTTYIHVEWLPSSGTYDHKKGETYRLKGAKNDVAIFMSRLGSCYDEKGFFMLLENSKKITASRVEIKDLAKVRDKIAASIDFSGDSPKIEGPGFVHKFIDLQYEVSLGGEDREWHEQQKLYGSEDVLDTLLARLHTAKTLDEAHMMMRTSGVLCENLYGKDYIEDSKLDGKYVFD